MKTKAIILVALTAIVTLSFTFASVNKPAEVKKTTSQEKHDAPAGGLVSEDKI
jgi:hypothetical protein